MKAENRGKQYEKSIAMRLNKWLCDNGKSNLMAVNKGRSIYYPDIGILFCNCLGHPRLDNPFTEFGNYNDNPTEWINAQKFCDTFTFRKDSLPFLCFIEVKLNVRSQFGTPRYNFIDGRWIRNKIISSSDILLTRILNSSEFIDETLSFIDKMGCAGKNLVSYVTDFSGNVVSTESMLKRPGDKYIVSKTPMPSKMMADIIESYYRDGKESPSDYILIGGGKGVYRLSDSDVLGLGVPRFKDMVEESSIGFLAIRYIVRSRGCYEIVPEITLGDDNSLSPSNFLDF